MSGTSPLTLVFELAAPERADRALTRALLQRRLAMSRRRTKELFAEGRVRWGDRALQAAESLPAGSLTLTITRWSDSEAEKPRALASPRGCFLPVMYEDEDLLVLHKPSGVPSVPHEPGETETAVNAALARESGLAEAGPHGLEAGLLHRLDTGTSGLLAFAKSTEEYERLRTLWKTGGVRKTYRAVCTGTGEPPRRIEWPLAHDAKSAKRMLALREPEATRPAAIRGKPLRAVTEILGVTALPSSPYGPVLDLELVIETGVMHQIRCHLAAAGFPILGDGIYHGAASPRLWLHAWKLSLPLRSGALLHLQSQLPKDWP